MPRVKFNIYAKQSMKQKLMFSKQESKEVMRCVYPLNYSGSKQVMLGLDVYNNFRPVLTIGRVGWSGIRLTAEGFSSLSAYAANITTFFESCHNIAYEKFFLCSEIYVELSNNNQRKLVSFKHVTNEKNCVTLSPVTWEGFIAHLPLLKHLFAQYNHYQQEVTEIFKTIISFAECGAGTSVSSIIKALMFEDVSPYLDLIFQVDKCKIFYELQLTCLELFESKVKLDEITQQNDDEVMLDL